MAEAKTEDRELFLVQEGTVGRADSIYLDNQERIQAEVLRAAAEGREPETDLSKLPASVGTALSVREGLINNSLMSNITQDGTLPPKEPKPFTTTTVEVEPPRPEIDLSGAAQVARERLAQDQALVDAEGREEDTGTDTTSEGDTSTGLSSEGGNPDVPGSAATTDNLTDTSGFGPTV